MVDRYWLLGGPWERSAGQQIYCDVDYVQKFYIDLKHTSSKAWYILNLSFWGKQALYEHTVVSMRVNVCLNFTLYTVEQKFIGDKRALS